ncbi:MAG: septal ring lytic transglycosylase RlpA family protein [Desulfobacterales bacterium]
MRPHCAYRLLAIAAAWVLMGAGCSTPLLTPPPGPAAPPAAEGPPPAVQAPPKPYQVYGTWYQPLIHARGFTEKGRASWYGEKFHGRRTSNGEIYDMYALTAAHKTLPFDTYVKVRNLDNNRGVVVKINDRGPFVSGRIIDLSYTAAKEIGMLGPGTAPVEVVALGAAAADSSQEAPSYRPIDYQAGNFTFQVGAFRDPQNAERQRRELLKRFTDAHVRAYQSPAHGELHGVRVGRFENLDQAEAHRQRLAQNGFPDAFIVAE